MANPMRMPEAESTETYVSSVIPATPEAPATSTSSAPRYYNVPRKQLHLLSNPRCLASVMEQRNLGYQMAYSVKILEEELAEQGCYCVLQLDIVPGHAGSWQNPASWSLHVNGTEVAAGTAEYARECFYESATAFLDLCRNAVKSGYVSGEREALQLTEREYELLTAARKIACNSSVELRWDGRLRLRGTFMPLSA